MEKKKLVEPCLDVIMIAFFPRIYSEVLFLPEIGRKYWASAPLASPNTP